MIGIVSHADDLHTTEVVRHLDALGAPHALLDTGHAPRDVALTSTQDAAGWRADWVDTSAEGVSAVDTTTLRAVWWRRPQPFALHDDLRSAQDRGFAHGEVAAAVPGCGRACLRPGSTTRTATRPAPARCGSSRSPRAWGCACRARA